MITTRGVKIERQKIYTPHEVDFRYGLSHGRGRDLTITLLPADEEKQAHNDEEEPAPTQPERHRVDRHRRAPNFRDRWRNLQGGCQQSLNNRALVVLVPAMKRLPVVSRSAGAARRDHFFAVSEMRHHESHRNALLLETDPVAVPVEAQVVVEDCFLGRQVM